MDAGYQARLAAHGRPPHADRQSSSRSRRDPCDRSAVTSSTVARARGVALGRRGLARADAGGLGVRPLGLLGPWRGGGTVDAADPLALALRRRPAGAHVRLRFGFGGERLFGSHGARSSRVAIVRGMHADTVQRSFRERTWRGPLPHPWRAVSACSTAERQLSHARPRLATVRHSHLVRQEQKCAHTCIELLLARRALEERRHRRARERVPVEDVLRPARAHLPERRGERLRGVRGVEGDAPRASRASARRLARLRRWRARSRAPRKRASMRQRDAHRRHGRATPAAPRAGPRPARARRAAAPTAAPTRTRRRRASAAPRPRSPPPAPRRSPRAERHHAHVRLGQLAASHLRRQLARGAHVAHRADDARAAHRDEPARRSPRRRASANGAARPRATGKGRRPSPRPARSTSTTWAVARLRDEHRLDLEARLPPEVRGREHVVAARGADRDDALRRPARARRRAATRACAPCCRRRRRACDRRA